MKPVVLSIMLLFGAAAAAQTTPGLPPEHELFRTIARLDEQAFHAYNTCDLEKFGAFFVDDLEFYHDKGGLTRTRQSLLDSVKNNICGKVRRELVPGTLAVYPLDKYGALQTGIHRFYEAGQPQAVGEARFIHLWQHKDGQWKMTRVISYDHQSLTR